MSQLIDLWSPELMTPPAPKKKKPSRTYSSLESARMEDYLIQKMPGAGVVTDCNAKWGEHRAKQPSTAEIDRRRGKIVELLSEPKTCTEIMDAVNLSRSSARADLAALIRRNVVRIVEDMRDGNAFFYERASQ